MLFGAIEHEAASQRHQLRRKCASSMARKQGGFHSVACNGVEGNSVSLREARGEEPALRISPKRLTIGLSDLINAGGDARAKACRSAPRWGFLSLKVD
ncbi:hypothetical protein BASA81_015292 [Batrachochytrium salamandrivorans]|nr:hypothetical protein BASA81_015292 [Batrachochytrium salamandrivorans]